MGENSEISWRVLDGNLGAYAVGADGTVWSRWERHGLGRGRGTVLVLGSEWKALKPSICGGYAFVNLGRNNKRPIAHLVLEAFVGPRPDGMECCHNDGNPTNNRLSNLRWDTSKANTDDQRRHGTLVGGVRHGGAKLSNEQVEEIRRLYPGMMQKDIASRFGVRQGTVSMIVTQKSRTSSSHAGKGR